MRKKKNKERGITLIEMVVTIAIIGIMTALVLSSMMSNRNQKQVETEGRKFIAVVKETQNNALTGKILNTGDLPCKYFLTLTSPNLYKVEYSYRTDPAADCDDSNRRLVGNYSIGNGVQFSGNEEISFDVPFGKIASSRRMTFGKDSQQYEFCICQSGTVVESGNCSTCDSAGGGSSVPSGASVPAGCSDAGGSWNGSTCICPAAAPVWTGSCCSNSITGMCYSVI